MNTTHSTHQGPTLDQSLLDEIYSSEELELTFPARYAQLVDLLKGTPELVISAPGRTELGGNHTDHQNGRVLCAAVQKDTLAVVSRRDDSVIHLHSTNLNEIYDLDIRSLSMNPDEKGTSEALIRGVLAGIADRGGKIGGFNAVLHSTVGIGSGLSSSASFEVLVGAIINELYNAGDLSSPELAKIGQYAENEYFGKPCGLMDQMSSAVGGILMIDFADPENIGLHSVPYDFGKSDYVLALIETGSSHHNLTPAYASVPKEMHQIAEALGVKKLRQASVESFFAQMKTLRESFGDRAVLRGMHFFHENERVAKMAKALQDDEFGSYLELVGDSSRSSKHILQNTIPPGSAGRDQGLAFALGLSQLLFEGWGRGVSRVHGGGFAGAMQAYIHKDDLDKFRQRFESALGEGCVEELKLRKPGVCTLAL